MSNIITIETRPTEKQIVRKHIKQHGQLIDELKAIVVGQAELLEEYRDKIDVLIKANNENRDQIQALLDFCFTDRKGWKEGQLKQIGITGLDG